MMPITLRRITSRQAIAGFPLALAAVAMLLAACEDDGSPSNDGDGAASPVTSTPTEAAATPSLTPRAATATATATQTQTPLPTPSTTPPATPPGDGQGEAAAAAAVEALASWLGPAGDRNSIVVTSLEAATWPDGCLGLAVPGRYCTGALVPGYRVSLALGNARYEVRTDEAGDAVLWAPETEVLVKYSESSANIALFTTDAGGSLEVQLVPGTVLDVDLAVLDEGQPVALGLVRAPQRDGFLAVWVAVPEA